MIKERLMKLREEMNKEGMQAYIIPMDGWSLFYSGCKSIGRQWYRFDETGTGRYAFH